MSGEQESDEGEKVRVLASSTELFYFYGQALEAGARLRCDAELLSLDCVVGGSLFRLLTSAAARACSKT